MDLVDEDDGLRSACSPRLARLFHQRLDVLDPRRGRGELNEPRPRAFGDDPRQRRLPRARRPPEDHRGDAVALDGVAEEASLAEEVLQADDVIERGWAEALGERRV